MRTRKRIRDEAAEKMKEAKEKAQEAKRPKPKGEDYLSPLPNDCLLDVLERLNHDDLDELTPLSRRLNSLAAQSRRKAGRVVAEKLSVVQVGDRTFDFLVLTSRMHYYARLTGNNVRDALLSKTAKRRLSAFSQQKYPTIFKPQAISGAVTERAAHLLERFEIKNCSFEYISIDDNFLAFFEYVTSSVSFWALALNSCYFDKNLDVGGRGRLVSLLRSTMPTKLRVDLCYDAPILDVDFLRDFAHSGKTPLNLHVFAEDDESTLRLADEQLAAGLANFLNFVMISLTVDTDWVMAPLLRRLRQKRDGFWKFRVTRPIDYSDIAIGLAANKSARWQHTRIGYPYGVVTPQGHCIQILENIAVRNHYLVYFNIVPTHDKQWDFTASFVYA